jgi:predicted signal transduction protein with EAL and GGDEF domain
MLGVSIFSNILYFARKYITNTKMCRFYITLGIAIGCLTWGIMAACSYLETPLFIHQDLILFATVGLSAGGAVSFSASRFYTYVYVLCMLIPILFVELFIVEQMIPEKVTTVIIYIIGLLWVTVNSSKEYMSARVSNIQLVEMSHTDGLTGVKNRRYFDSQLEEELQRARRTERTYCIINY